MDMFGLALLLGTIGLVAGVVGSVIAAFATSGATSSITSYVQHFAAGLIIAAATLDLLPEAFELGGGWPLIVGFVLGTAFMLGLRELLTRFGHGHSHGSVHDHGAGHGDAHAHDRGEELSHEHAHGDARIQTKVSRGVNVRLISALVVVVLIDGAIIGVALTAGGAAALLIAIALSIELLFVAAWPAGGAGGGGGWGGGRRVRVVVRWGRRSVSVRWWRS